MDSRDPQVAAALYRIAEASLGRPPGRPPGTPPREGDSPVTVTPEQWREQAVAVKRLADVLVKRDVPAEALRPVVKRLKDNVDELMSWIEEDA